MTSPSVHFHPAVSLDLDEAALWYAVEAGLGAAFLDEFVGALDRILSGPRKYQRVRGQIRRANLRRFPYGIYFEVNSDGSLAVYAVASLERDPFYWLDRVRRR